MGDENMGDEDIKYILVSGGVISGIGKGVITSSIGTLLKSIGLRVTAIKIDPYLNIDAGTFSPYEHGACMCVCACVACMFTCMLVHTSFNDPLSLQVRCLFSMMVVRLI